MVARGGLKDFPAKSLGNRVKQLASQQRTVSCVNLADDDDRNR